ncbi:hypothetical protein [Nocardioides sp.]|uniref:hypothetical protein n=1 Tax=Nocardioides sp. TaxID=35761 RepID=UPI002617D7F6|nr:hypothetical protein [Nocardioides sp.]
MGEWASRWGDEGAHRRELIPFGEREPRPVPHGCARLVEATFHGWLGLDDPVLVIWDNEREVVRLMTGEIRWYAGDGQQAFPRDGQIVVESEGVYPPGNRYMDALAVRSLQDLMDEINATEIVAVDPDRVIHVMGRQDGVRAEVEIASDSGIVLRASGVQGTIPFSVEVRAIRLIEGEEVLEPVDVHWPYS